MKHTCTDKSVNTLADFLYFNHYKLNLNYSQKSKVEKGNFILSIVMLEYHGSKSDQIV